MDLTEFGRILWRRKLIMLVTLMAVVAVAVALLTTQTRIYEATSTINLTPRNPEQAVFLLSTINVLTPIYAEGVKSRDTRELARLKAGEALADLSVRTFRDSSILKIDARSPRRELAQITAQAATDALLERVSAGQIGPTALTVQQIDRPVLPTEPVLPRPRLTILVASFLGLGFGVGAALLRENLRRKIESGEALSQVAGAPLFAEIPTDRAVTSLRSPVALSTEPRYRVLAEALRDLRTNLQYSEGGFRSVLITSPEGRHGKTTVSFGLAATLARAGATTLLVDGDLRRGRLDAMLGVDRSPGLTEVLEGFSLEDAVRTTSLDMLWVLPGGRQVEDPSEMLEAEFFTFLYKAERSYDAVVIDGTPLVPINDARIMSRHTTCTILVANSGQVTRRQLRVAVERLAIINVEPTAVVLNNSKLRRRASYYSYLNPVEGERQ